MPKEITSLEEFKEIMQKTDGVIVVDSMALWCGPCSMIAPKIEKLAHDNPDVHFYKFDVDNVPKLSEYLNVTAMPTFFFCRALSVGPSVRSGVPNQFRFQSITLSVEAGSMLFPLTFTTAVESEMVTSTESID